MVNAPGARIDIGWEHVIDLGQRKVKCKFCSSEFTNGIYRFKHHLPRSRKDASAFPMVTMSDEGDRTCPLCVKELDLTDQQLNPCKCGYDHCTSVLNSVRGSSCLVPKFLICLNL
ncbi:hypothetical protein CTI12_AA172290 [Artemisia annua]|uniref:Uncharacterized protein n=1 Tax=Artemisia annua TaxID=35608 RepID=A0A2U1PBQ4_ARTAN|nr:hypothetical protein CTI12_AA172290 [Artemisia annua]